MATTDSTTKQCTKCGEIKPATPEYFHRKQGGVLGLHSWCKLCCRELEQSPAVKAYRKQYNASENGKARSKRHADKPERKAAHLEFSRRPDQKEKQKQRDSKPERKLTRKKYAQSLAGKESIRRSRKSEKGRIRLKQSNDLRRARIRKAEGNHSSADINQQFSSQNGLCWWCGCKLDLSNFHVDHIIPLSRGGSNWPNNICVACSQCNLSKNNKLPHEWIGRLL